MPFFLAADRARAIRTEAMLVALTNESRTIMALSAQTLAIVGQLNDATNAIAAEIQTISNAHPDDADLQAALAPIVTKLQGLAVNPAAPVPGVAPPPAS